MLLFRETSTGRVCLSVTYNLPITYLFSVTRLRITYHPPVYLSTHHPSVRLSSLSVIFPALLSVASAFRGEAASSAPAAPFDTASVLTGWRGWVAGGCCSRRAKLTIQEWRPADARSRLRPGGLVLSHRLAGSCSVMFFTWPTGPPPSRRVGVNFGVTAG